MSIEGDFELRSASDKTLLLREVTGDLKIDSPTSDLPQLRCLETVGGDLDVQVQTGDLSALGHLRSVRFSLTIRGNREMRDLTSLTSLTSVGTALTIVENDALVDLSGLEALASVFELHIQHNPKLENLDALTNLTSRGGDLEIYGNGALRDLKGLHRFTKANSLSITHNPLLHDLTGIDGLTAAPSAVAIVGNAALVDLTGLAGIESTVTLFIADNPAIRNLAGLDKLASARDITLSDNVGLENIDALGTSLTSLGSFSLTGSPKVTTVEVLSKFTTLEGVALGYSGVNTLHGLRNIEHLDALYLAGIKIKDLSGLGQAIIGSYLNFVQLSELESLSGLSPDIHALRTLWVEDCPKLRDLAGLEMIESVLLLIVQSSPKLESLAGLENLTQVERFTLIHSGLTSLASLDNLLSISEHAEIEGNTKLSACDIEAFVTRTGAPTSTLSGNGPCN